MSTTSTPKTSDSSPFNIHLRIKTEGENLLLIKSISTLLEEIILKNKKKKYKINKDSFFSDKIPSLSLYEYITSIVKNTKISMSTLIISIASITTLMKKIKNSICKNNIYKLIITSIFLHSKFYEDQNHSLKLFSQAGRINYEELYQLEIQYYILCEYSLLVKENIFQQYFNFFQNKAEKMKL